MEKKLDELWADGEGRVLLINLANQLHSGVVTRKSISAFLKKLAREDADFSTRSAALADEPETPGSFKLENLHFASHCGLTDGSKLKILRVIPFKSILDAIELEGVSPTQSRANQGAIERELRTIRNPSTSRQKRLEAEARLLKFLSHGQERSKILSQWNLPSSFDELALATAKVKRFPVGLRADRLGAPTFFTRTKMESGTTNPMFETDRSAKRDADYFRDSLGLDHYGATFRRERVVLGFYIAESQKINAKGPTRPTPFDDTSPARFRASFGQFGGVIGELGKTADLAKIGVEREIDGFPELIVPNNYFESDEEDVIVGYLGTLEVARGDTYRTGTNLEPLDRAFEEACIGEWSRDDVFNTMNGGNTS